MLRRRLLDNLVLGLVVALMVGSFGPWAETDAGSLERFGIDRVSIPPLAIWVGLLVMRAQDQTLVRRWHTGAAVVIAFVIAATASIDVVTVTGGHLGSHPDASPGWGLAITFLAAHLLVVAAATLTWVDHRSVARQDPAVEPVVDPAA